MGATEQEVSDFANEMEAAMGYPALRGFLSWAWNKPEMRAQFTADTGLSWPPPPKNSLDVLIDQATGAREGHAEAFLLWAVRTHWGDELLPEALRERAFPDGPASPLPHEHGRGG